jgi:hypothetical protein
MGSGKRLSTCGYANEAERTGSDYARWLTPQRESRQLAGTGSASPAGEKEKPSGSAQPLLLRATRRSAGVTRKE